MPLELDDRASKYAGRFEPSWYVNDLILVDHSLMGCLWLLITAYVVLKYYGVFWIAYLSAHWLNSKANYMVSYLILIHVFFTDNLRLEMVFWMIFVRFLWNSGCLLLLVVNCATSLVVHARVLLRVVVLSLMLVHGKTLKLWRYAFFRVITHF